MFKSVDPSNTRYTKYLVLTVLALLGLFAVFAGKSPASQGSEIQITDEELLARVEAQLAQDPEIDTIELRTTVELGEVRLSGQVKSYAARERIHETVRNTQGVTRMLSGVTIRGPELLRRASDDQIVAAVESKLGAHRLASELEVQSKGGMVTLSGQVRSVGAKEKAGLLALSTASVRTVDNRLRVTGR